MVKVIDFYADWCGPCKMMEPVLEELKKELSGKVEFEKVNVDEQSERAAKYGVMSIPTFVVELEGKESDRLVGYMPKEEFKKKLQAYL
jgi:thioredoxin 1